MTQVLILLDGFYRFDSSGGGFDDFTFVRLVEILTDAGMSVKKAHRDADSSADIQNVTLATADDPNDDSVLNLNSFDVIWMFGADGNSSGGANNLSAAEILAVETYMGNGGGVFATGDHESIGADMCGRIPRVRLMRAWYGNGNLGNNSPMLSVPNFPRNFDQSGEGRADTLQRNPNGSYPTADRVWFENQSDSVPQPISPTSSPAHSILRHAGRELVVYADHMHEGHTLGSDDLQGIFDYTTAHPLDDGSGRSVIDFPVVNGNRELPYVIATGSVGDPQTDLGEANSGNSFGQSPASEKTVNTLCVYDGLAAGVGRIVTASTFHHYIDINLDGDSGLNATGLTNAGADAEKGKGFYGTNSASAVYQDIKQIFINITNWLAKPNPNMELILERSTISEDEATANSLIDAAIVVTVDGIRPSQFSNGPITSLGSPPQLASWAPAVTFPAGSGLTAVPTEVDSDDPSLSDRLQRFTFTYRIVVNVADAFDFGGDATDTQEVTVTSTFAPAVGASQSDFAVVKLVRTANPFMLDLANNNQTHWLSSDVRVFRVVAGRVMNGKLLPANASRAQALTFLNEVISDMTIAQFESISITRSGSALSSLPTTTATNTKVYNFAVARVRLNGSASVANNVRVFFRIFTSQTTAALTFTRGVGDVPSGGYLQTQGNDPISLPSPNGAGDEWLSIPMFAADRDSTPADQEDPNNVKASIGPAGGSQISTFYGALIDSNLDDADIQESPNAAGTASVRDVLMGEHQCIVAQVEYQGTPIPAGSRPSTSDKLSQRNIAFSAVANPGTNASRAAIHTFEIEATKGAIGAESPPDELVLKWDKKVPDGTCVQIFISTWNAQSVVDLADRFYSRHEIEVVDDHTVSIPAGGTRYVPIPRSKVRQTGVMSAHLPLGIVKGQRFDLSIRQISNRTRGIPIPGVTSRQISLKEAATLMKKHEIVGDEASEILPRGVFDLGRGRSLITDLSVIDEFGDFAVIMQSPSAKKVEEIRRQNGRWRELVGAFQLGIPVSTRADMLNHHLRVHSQMLWRFEKISSRSRWLSTMTRYIEMSAEKVRALGGRPALVPATPDGIFDLDSTCCANPCKTKFEEPGDKGSDLNPGSKVYDGFEGIFDDNRPDRLVPSEDWLVEKGSKTNYAMSGKISGLIYDHFGDFEGFTLEDNRGRHLRFVSRESAILKIAQESWLQRYVVTVIPLSQENRTVVSIIVRGYS